MQSAFGVELPATVMFDYPTPAALAGFIVSRAAPAQPHTELMLLEGTSLAHGQLSADQQGSTTEIVGWAAAVASPGNPDTCERLRRCAGGPTKSPRTRA